MCERGYGAFLRQVEQELLAGDEDGLDGKVSELLDEIIEECETFAPDALIVFKVVGAGDEVL